MGRSTDKDAVEQGYIEAERASPTRTCGVELPQAPPPRPSRRLVATQVKRPHIAATLNTIDNILWAELKLLEQKVADGKPLEDHEVRRFAVLSDIAMKKTKEEREQEKHERYDDLPDEELLKGIEEATKLLKGD